MNKYEEYLSEALEIAKAKIESLYYQLSIEHQGNAITVIQNEQLRKALSIAHNVICEKCSNTSIPRPCKKCWVKQDKNGRIAESEGE